MPKKLLKSKTTLDELAMMIARGFESTATKGELKSLESEMKTGFAKVDLRLDDLEKR